MGRSRFDSISAYHRQGPGTSSMAVARGAFKCRRKGLGVVRIAALRSWHTTDIEQCMGICLAVRSIRASR
eukprot:1218432-Prymnesium_polylepis.1